MWWFVLAACGGDEVEGECAEDADCLDLYSVEMPFCGEGATCVECTLNTHCESHERCYDEVCDVANCNTADCD